MENKEQKLLYQIGLTLLPGVGPVLAKNLISYCGSAEGIFKAKKSQLEKIPGIGEERAAAILNQDVLKRAEQEADFLHKTGVNAYFYLDDEYPKRLKNCDDAPVMLYFKGNCNLNVERMVAIVGTRNATTYGKELTKALVEGLSKYRVSIISGLAYGIDIAAHKAAVEKDIPNAGVLAHGLDRIYPDIHKPVAEKMLGNGGLITEFLSGTNPDKENFPSRNRIIAGMADAVVVVESGERGGSLITADIAFSYNRDVFAFPGKVNDGNSKGCNSLIRLNKAGLIEHAGHLAEAMSWTETEVKRNEPEQLEIFRELNQEEKALIELLRTNGKLDIDTLMLRSGFPVNKISSTLLNLEFEGILKALPGKVFELK